MVTDVVTDVDVSAGFYAVPVKVASPQRAMS